MSHDETAGDGPGVSEPGHGHNQDLGRQPHEDRREGSAAELDDQGGAELGRGGQLPARSDERRPPDASQTVDAEVTPPPNQPTLPGFDSAAFSISYSRSAPLPMAAELAEYDRFMPGLAREIVNEAHANMASDRKSTRLLSKRRPSSTHVVSG